MIQAAQHQSASVPLAVLSQQLCYMQYATCNMQHATCTDRVIPPVRVEHAKLRNQVTLVKLPVLLLHLIALEDVHLHATCSMQHAACNMQHATCNKLPPM